MSERDTGLGREIDWTGERCVPWADDIQVVYEHYHRYALAACFAAGRRVLDLAGGEGYGAALLAATAAEVVAVDIDEASIKHAQHRYRDLANVRFELGSITERTLLADAGQFDLITCFEAIEHVSEHDEVMRLVRARLAPGGVFLVSTPDIAVYTHQHGNENPYHVRELTEAQFRDLIAGTFAHVRLLRQNVAMGSVLVDAVDATAGEPSGPFVAQTLRRTSDESWSITSGVPHTYLVAIAADHPLDDMPVGAALLDPDLTLLRSAIAGERRASDARLAAEANEHAGRIAEERAARRAADDRADRSEERAKQADDHARAAHDRADTAEARAEQLTRRCDELAAAERQARSDFEDAKTELGRLRLRSELDTQRLTWLTESARQARAEAARLAGANAKLVEQSSALANRLLDRYRSTIERYAPRGTTRRNAYERALGRPTGIIPAAADLGPVAVTTSATPLVTVIIPVYGQWAYTRRCLASIESSASMVPFEVIVVDDCSPDDTAARVAECTGVRRVRTPRNLGFVGACNLGAANARAELLVFLNNDTEVRGGWLEALVETAHQDERIGLVGAKLVYPDDSLQECGGIVWSDGTGWNYGRGDRPDDPRYAALRDVDYCSGAALLVRRGLFDELGGFDDRYSPAYYEDTDLAFAVRAAGYRTVVQPAAVVVHHEGVTHGTDVNAGVKRHQEINRSAFVAKWADVLAEHLPESTPTNLWLARQRTTTSGHGGRTVLVVDHQVPTPDRDSGSLRMRRLLDQLVALDQRVVFIPVNGAPLQPYTEQLERAGVTVLADPVRQDEFLRDAGPTLGLVVLSRPNVAWHIVERIRDNAPGAMLVYDTVDLHFVRLDREAELAERLGDPHRAAALRGRATVARELELALVRLCDATLVVSATERALLGELVPDAEVEVVSNVHSEFEAVTGPGGRTDVLFVGGFDHPPNRDAAKWLATEIMPLVRRRCPDAELHLVGSNITDELRMLAGDGVVVHGWVPDLGGRYRAARVAVAPLRFGAGVKGKVGESLACGVPVVGTAVAFEGMGLVADEHVLVGETAAELAAAIVALLTGDDLWHRLARAGQRAVTERFGPAVARERLRGLLDRAEALAKRAP